MHEVVQVHGVHDILDGVEVPAEDEKSCRGACRIQQMLSRCLPSTIVEVPAEYMR